MCVCLSVFNSIFKWYHVQFKWGDSKSFQQKFAGDLSELDETWYVLSTLVLGVL